MRVSRRRTLGLAIPLLVLFSLPARSQNLLVNPGFDKDLSGWTVTTPITPDPSPGPGYVEASAGWVTNDRSGSSSSGGASFHARAFTMSYATSTASQCIPLPAGTVASFGAQILTTRQYVTASAEVSVTFFAAAACSGSALASASASSLTTSVLPQESTSGGLWLPAAGLAVVPNPSEIFLAGRPSREPGSVVVASMDGTRPIFCELQDLDLEGRKDACFFARFSL